MLDYKKHYDNFYNIYKHVNIIHSKINIIQKSISFIQSLCSVFKENMRRSIESG